MTKSHDRYVSLRCIKKFQQICNPMTAWGIVEFTHDISFPKGEISILSTNGKVFRHWYKNRIPTIRTDENGRTLEDGIYLSSILEENFPDCAEIAPVFNALCNANQSVAIMENDQDCQHLFSFSINRSGKEFIHWLINHSHLLKNFIEYYKYSAKEIILEAKLSSNRISVPLIKNNPDDDVIQIAASPLTIKLIHKDSRIPIFLSKQQSISLMLLTKGKSAKEIGLTMGLSFRTVQHYLERIKKLLGCNSYKELIIYYGNQVAQENLRANDSK